MELRRDGGMAYQISYMDCCVFRWLYAGGGDGGRRRCGRQESVVVGDVRKLAVTGIDKQEKLNLVRNKTGDMLIC
jgi:hypothetical protein